MAVQADYAGDKTVPWPSLIINTNPSTKAPSTVRSMTPRPSLELPHPALGARVVVTNREARERMLARDPEVSFYGHVAAITTLNPPQHLVQIAMLTHADRENAYFQLKNMSMYLCPYTYALTVRLSQLTLLKGAGFTDPIWSYT